ncbi:tensin-4-like [Osmerus eperlanus]|uniref:tensin-4-like n=1 Tax=Osmerus eperlanus TaxID=29151 RepID=UPI002E0D62B6
MHRRTATVMPMTKNMSHTVANHILRVGQSVRLDPTHEALGRSPCPGEPIGDCDVSELDVSLDTLNQLILELDPTFEPIQVNKRHMSCSRHQTDDSSPEENVSSCVLVSRGCSPGSASSMSRSMPIPVHPSPSCSPHGSLVFSDSPMSSRPPLPCGSVYRRAPSYQGELSCSPAVLRMSPSQRSSAVSLLSTSPGSDTSYILGSCQSLFSEDGDSPERLMFRTSGSFSDVSRPTKPFSSSQSPDKRLQTGPSPIDHCPGIHSKGFHSSPASLAGSLTDIPVVLVNGAPEPELQSPPEMHPTQTIQRSLSRPSSPHSVKHMSNGSQSSMKFVMDTSKFWFCPHINRTEAEALLRDKAPGSFVVRDSTSYQGSFGLAMKLDKVPTNISPTSQLGLGSSDLIRHFLIESSAKGVRIKGASQEPYFGSLSALVYQHTITPYALPCKLRLQSQDQTQAEEAANDKLTEDMTKTACNYLYLCAAPTEMLTGPCAVQKAVTFLLQKNSTTTPTIVNLKVSPKGVTLTDIQRKLFFRRHYPAHLLSYSGEDPDKRLWLKGSKPARVFGMVVKDPEAGMENICHVFAEHEALQPCNRTNQLIQVIIDKM